MFNTSGAYYGCHSIHLISVNPVSIAWNKQSNINALIIYRVINKDPLCFISTKSYETTVIIYK